MTQALIVSSKGGLAQGDLIVAPLARTTSAFFTPERWDALDEHQITIPAKGSHGAIEIFAGRAVLMVTSHDCHHDKEWNEEVRRRMKQGLPQADAESQAESDPTLDRTFQASPVVRLDDFPKNKREALQRGQIVGYLPVPDDSATGLPLSVVDLTYRVTIDRIAIESRIGGLNEVGRAQLRYSIARFDSLRSVSLGFDIERVVGRQISDVQVTKNNVIEISLTLDNGEQLRFLQQPTEPAGGGRRQM
jgi:hypothetical protein